MLLDTCVLSELRLPQANPEVVKRLREFEESQIHVSVISFGEVVRGIELLPIGARRRELATWAIGLERQYAGGVLSVDLEISKIWGELSASSHQQGFQLATTDGLIAATAIRHGLQVVTRNVRHFRVTGVELINPWDE